MGLFGIGGCDNWHIYGYQVVGDSSQIVVGINPTCPMGLFGIGGYDSWHIYGCQVVGDN